MLQHAIKHVDVTGENTVHVRQVKTYAAFTVIRPLTTARSPQSAGGRGCVGESSGVNAIADG